MNGKKARQLRKKAKHLLINWIRSMTPEGEDSKKINEKNLHEFLPEQTHVYLNNKFMLSSYSYRWFYKKIKENPDVTLENIND